jgi:cyclophilin family peptidyl-prolyl cis-trans isomerase
MFRRPILLALALLASLSTRGAGPAAPAPANPEAATGLPDGLYAEFTTPRGVIIAELYYPKVPLVVASFTGLAEGTLGPAPRRPFFDGLTFHRVVPDFVVQGGDPTGTGEGGPGYEFPDEFVPGLRHDAAGVLSMANDGPDTNGSQFFFTLREVNHLNYLYSVFGRVVRGLAVLPQIRQGDQMQVKILRAGAAAQAFRADDAAFAALRAGTPPYAGRPTPGPAAQFYDPDGLLPTEPPRAKIFNWQLANFEHATGVRICAQVYRTFQPDHPGDTVNDLRGRLARALGVELHGVLALYFADRDEWSLWIGDSRLDAFNPRGLQLHARKQEFIAAARGRALALQPYVQKMVGPDKPLTDAQKLTLLTGEVVGNLMELLEPAAPPSAATVPPSAGG